MNESNAKLEFAQEELERAADGLPDKIKRPVNDIKGWKDVGSFDKKRYMEWQKSILSSVQ